MFSETQPLITQFERPLRVLVISPRLPTADRPGSMAPALRQIESLRKLGLEMIVQDMRGLPVVKYGPAIPRMRNSLKDVDLVHAHFGYCGWIGRMQRSKPLVISFMGDDLLGTPSSKDKTTLFSRLMVQLNKRLARWGDEVIVKSQEMAEVIRPAKCHVVANGVDTDNFRPIAKEEARQRLGLKKDQLYVLFPGDPSNPRKGFALAEAARLEAEKKTGHSIETFVLWGKHPEDVPYCMNACDAMWMTSLIEGSPNVVKEAMACNIPIAGVDVGDVAWLLNGVHGYAVCPREPVALGAIMADMLTQNHDVGGREAIFKLGLGIEQVAQRVVSIYRMALEKKSQSTGLAAVQMVRGEKVS
jgi:glycosyltransferase involved in cell wall biosynthesis